MTLVNLAKEKRLRHKLYYTLLVLLVSTTLTEIPIPGLDSTYLKAMFGSISVVNFMDAMSGGALSKLAVGSFGITSYITASILIQLLSVLFPQIDKIRREGRTGQKFIDRITFILAMVITLTTGLAFSMRYGKMGLFTKYSALSVIIATGGWLIGSAIIILLAQKVEDYGIGNGTMLVLAFNIMSRFPGDISSLYIAKIQDKPPVLWTSTVIAAVVLTVFVYFVTVYLQMGSLKIPIKQSRKTASIMNDDAELPIPVNVANVMPVIYAASLVSFPVLIVRLFNIPTNDFFNKVIDALTTSNWFKPTAWYHLAGLVLYLLLICVFGQFASQMTFSGEEIADHMRKSGDVVPGVNPGKDTAVFFERRRKILSWLNVLFLMLISVIPDFVCSQLGITQFTFLGTSLIIVINMLFDTHMRLKAASIHNDKRFALFSSKKGGAV